jgi:D-aspartate ligase
MRYLNNPAILFGPDSINGLGLARNLGRNGVKVYCVAEQKNEIAFSRYCKRFFVLPHIERDKEVLRTFLSRIGRELQHPAVIFPGSDLFCLSLSRLRDEQSSELNDKYIFFGRTEAVETLVNKKKFYQSLDKYNVPHPNTYFPETYADMENISKRVEYPAYLRPSISPLFKRFQKKGFVVQSQDELINHYELALRYNIDVMVQEIIPGPATSLVGISGYFDKNYGAKGFFAYRRLREFPQRFGTNSLIESISISNVLFLKETIEKYLRSLRYCGIFEAEFKRDQRDGSFKLLEINARSWWQNSFPTKCGINVILMAYLDAIGERIYYTDTYSVGVKWLFFFNDLLSSVKMLHERQMSISEWLSSFKRIEDYALFSADDPLPWIVSPLFISRKYAQVLRTRALIRPLEIFLGREIKEKHQEE